MKKKPHNILLLPFCALLFGWSEPAGAQSSWTGANMGTDMNWSDAGNWSGGAPGSSSTVTFPDGAFPVTTNTVGAVNNVVQSSTTISSLTYNNLSGDNDTTLIPSSSILTVNGNVTIGPGNSATVVTMIGGGSLIAGSGASTLQVQSTTGTAVMDLSTLTNFSFNSGGAGGPVNLGFNSSSSSMSGKVNLANGSNVVVSTTLSLGNNNGGGSGTLNLGNGTNNIFADTIILAGDKTSGTMQFLNNAGGGLKIANHTGTGRATINVNNIAGSGSTSGNVVGNLSFNGGTVNILASTLTVGNRGNRAQSGGNGSATGILSFNAGVVDATTIRIATNGSGGAPVTGTISVGGGKLSAGTGGISMVYQAGTLAGKGSLIVTNGGTVTCSGNIFKGSSAGTATITLSGGNLTLSGATSTMGVINGASIDVFNITNSTLAMPAATTNSIVVNNFNPDATTQNTININGLPAITASTMQFPLIAYTTAGGNLNSFVLGTLPGSFTGYISNNVANSSIDLVLTNAIVAKADEWGGGVNNLWDTTTLNWTNTGTAVNYNDLDFVTFDDLAQANTVNLTGTRQPGSLTFNNNSLNFTLTGVGKIAGATLQLVKNNNASVTLAEAGGDSFGGGILVNAGKLILDDTNSSISGGLTIANGATAQVGNNDGVGTLPSGTLDDEGTLIFNRTNNLTVSTAIPGGGALTQNGSGTLTLSANNGFTGVTTVNAGTLALSGSGAIASSSTVNVNSATLDVSAVSSSATLTTLDLTNAVLNVKVGYIQTNLNLTSGLNMGGAGNTINFKTLPAIVYYPATVTLLHSANPIVGYNFTLGTLPAATPSYVGSISESGDQMSVLLTLTSGPTNTRPSVTWAGADAISSGITNWSDAQNWLTPGVPMTTESVTFNNTDTAGGTPFDVIGDGGSGIVTPANVNNYVDINQTNVALTYANTGGSYHNTQIAPGKTLTLNGSLAVTSSGANVSILGAGGTLQINNPGNTTAINVQNSTAPTLDLSGLDKLNANVSQIAVGVDATTSTTFSGNLYLARTNVITTGAGNLGTAAALLVGSTAAASSSQTAKSSSLYLGQTNSLYVDGIILGAGQSTADVMTFNPAVTNLNPVAYIRGITGSSSRVTTWSLGDASVNINNTASGNGHIVDLSGGTLNALVSSLIVGQGSQGNTANVNLMGTFNMGLGNLDVTSLQIGVSEDGKTGGTGIGIMNVTGGTVVAGTLGLGVGSIATSSGTLNLTNATLFINNPVSIGSGAANLNFVSSTVKLLNATTIGVATPLTTLNLDGATLQLNVDGTASTAVIRATTVTTNNPTAINIGSVANVSGSVQLPLISYTGNDPYGAISLGTVPAGYNASLVDNTGNSSVDLSLVSTVNTSPTNITYNVGGNMLTLSWPADHTGWRLQAQTNSLSTGLSTNWFDVAGSTSVNSLNITINPANGNVFYRLAY